MLNKYNLEESRVSILAGNFDQLDVDEFIGESLKMSRFRHAHVMGLIGVCLDAGRTPYIVMPYMANGSLVNYLKKERINIVLLDDTEMDEVGIICMSEQRDVYNAQGFSKTCPHVPSIHVHNIIIIYHA